MNKVRRLSMLVAVLAAINLASAQISLKVEAIPGASNTWGVYTKVCEDVQPTGNTITGTGQVTVKFPIGLTLSNFTNNAGTWSLGSTINGPAEAPAFAYTSFGFVVDNPQIIYQPDSETLLFSFKLNGNATGAPQLIVNTVDPFDHLPNSANSNPGNELTVLDFGTQPLGLYTYIGNYSGNEVITCETTEPGDTTVIDPPIDTTGNVDTTVIDTTGNVDTTVIDTTGGVDTTIIDTTGNTDTTVITPPIDTTQTSGVIDLKQESNYFDLYPTPTNEWITVKFLNPDLQGGTVRLFTLNGTAIGVVERGQKEMLRLNVGGLPAGLYLLRYDLDGATLQQRKFLKQ